MDPLLQVRDLTVGYSSDDGRQVTALNGVSFEIVPGEAVGLLGESGCGKSTLALTLLRLLPRRAHVLRGSIVFRGKNLLGLTERELQPIRGAGISMVYQEPGMALNPVIRAGDQIAEVLRAHQPMSRRSAREQAKELLAKVGLSGENCVAEAYPHQLSGGQKQRVVIAQAIACRPSMIIADEPDTALDSVTQVEILTLLSRLKTELGIALLFITHDPRPLTQLAGRVMVMYAGRMIEEGTVEQVLLKPLHPYTNGLLQARPAGLLSGCHKRRLPAIPGSPPDLASLPPGCAFEARCSERMESCKALQPALFPDGDSRRVACLKYAN